MQFTGKYLIPAAPGAVWDALHDPAKLAAAIPGCETVEKLSDTEIKASATIKIGPVKARFEGNVRLEEMPPPPGVTRMLLLKGEGQGGAAGFARGESEVRLSLEGSGTLLQYEAKATIGGRLAQVGQRLIDGAAKSIADEFFAKFAAQMQASPILEPAPPLATPRQTGIGPQIWVAGLIGAVIILLAVFSFFP